MNAYKNQTPFSQPVNSSTVNNTGLTNHKPSYVKIPTDLKLTLKNSEPDVFTFIHKESFKYGPEGKQFSTRYIAQNVKLSNSTVGVALKTLLEKNYIIKTREATQYSGAWYKTNLKQINKNWYFMSGFDANSRVRNSHNIITTPPLPQGERSIVKDQTVPDAMPCKGQAQDYKEYFESECAKRGLSINGTGHERYKKYFEKNLKQCIKVYGEEKLKRIIRNYLDNILQKKKTNKFAYSVEYLIAKLFYRHPFTLKLLKFEAETPRDQTPPELVGLKLEAPQEQIEEILLPWEEPDPTVSANASFDDAIKQLEDAVSRQEHTNIISFKYLD